MLQLRMLNNSEQKWEIKIQIKNMTSANIFRDITLPSDHSDHVNMMTFGIIYSDKIPNFWQNK